MKPAPSLIALLTSFTPVNSPLDTHNFVKLKPKGSRNDAARSFSISPSQIPSLKGTVSPPTRTTFLNQSLS